MQIKTSKDALLTHLQSLSLPLDTLTLAQGVDSMLAFYRDERATECEPNTDADMLLFEWGTYDWGEGENFEFNITRQFIDANEDDDCIWQLSLGFKFFPSDEFNKLGSGNKWCGNLNALTHFDRFIRESDAYQTIAAKIPREIQLELEVTG